MTTFCAHSQGPHRPANGSRGGEGRPRREGGGALSHLLPVTDQPAYEDRLRQRDRAAPGGSRHGRTILVLVPGLSLTSLPSRVAHLWPTPLVLDLQHLVLVVVRAVPPPGSAGLAAGGGAGRAGGSQGAGGSGCGPDASAEGHNQRSPQVGTNRFPIAPENAYFCFGFPFFLKRDLLFFRLYPVVPANARVIAERDIQVGGYLIPKNVRSCVRVGALR